jgi:replicative superfamily II helicase
MIVRERMNQVMFDKIMDILPQQRQVMVFVHARKDTVRTGYTIQEMARDSGSTALFQPDPEVLEQDSKLRVLMQELEKSRNRELRELAQYGIGIHHAGMLRSDRTLVERLFSEGLLKVLVCTATLAWGVNLPAYAVIIKGTNVYDSEKGAFIDLSILDVMQIFGR